MLMNRESGDENGEIKIDAGETGQTERDAEKVAAAPRENYAAPSERIVTSL